MSVKLFARRWNRLRAGFRAEITRRFNKMWAAFGRGEVALEGEKVGYEAIGGVEARW